MRMRTIVVGVACLVLGFLASAYMPKLTAQTTSDTCQAAWDVVIGDERAPGDAATGWHGVKWNRCSGEIFVFSANDHKTKPDVWPLK